MFDPEPLGQEEADEVERFRWALDLEEGFAFHLIVADTRDVLEAALARLPQRPAILRPRPPRDLSAEEAATQILAELDRVLDASPNGPVLLDAMIAHREPAWGSVFRRLNELRNGLERRHSAPLLLAVSPAGEASLGREAPDLWSRRGSGMRLRDSRRAASAPEQDERLPPPDDPAAFESLCLDLFREIWNDPGAQKYGRSGQMQAGVDIFGKAAGRRIGVQCKQKDGRLRTQLTVRELEKEVENALGFRPALQTLILATTGPRDAKAQAQARRISKEHEARGLFQVEVWSWAEIWNEIQGRAELLRRILPIYWPRHEAAQEIAPSMETQDALEFLGREAKPLSRLTESVEPMRAGLQAAVRMEDWGSAAVHAHHLSGMELTLGDVSDSVYDAEQAVDFADRSGDESWRVVARTTLAEALHQAGRWQASLTLFREAEAMHAERQPPYPLLYSLSGFKYCDLLLDEVLRAAEGGHETPASRGRSREVEQRAALILEWSEQNRAPLLDIALHRLTLARSSFYRALLEGSSLYETRAEIEHAIDSLRKSGDLTRLPLGLLTRAWLRVALGDADGARADLDEAQEITVRGPMLLLLADVHLYRARLFQDRAALAEARRLIEKHGYGRRLEELADLEEAAADWSTSAA